MNRCTLLHEILHAHVARQPLEPYWSFCVQQFELIIKGQGHMVFGVFCVRDTAATPRMVLSLE